MFKLVFIRYFARIICIGFTLCGCTKIAGLDKKTSNAPEVFNEACEIINNRYALFDLKTIDWQAACRKESQLIANSMSQNDLFKVLGTHLMALKDGHVSLISDSDTTTYTGFYSPYPTNFNFKNITSFYLNNSYEKTGPFIYAIRDNVGYLYYHSFYNDFSDSDVAQVFSFFKNVKGLIVDIRNNTGGKYANVERLFSHFITARRLVKYETSKKGSGHSDFFVPEPYYVQPAGNNLFLKKVCVLTNRKCFSACNDFVSFMSDLPNVMQVGNTTGGGGGLPNRYLLKNGWYLQYTATKTLSAGGLAIENGITPDYLVNITPVDETTGKDPIIEKAYSLLQ